MSNKLDESLEQLDLHGVMMLQGLLVNRALKLIYEQKAKDDERAKLLVPDSKLIL